MSDDEEVIPVYMTPQLIQNNLSLIGRTFDGTSYAYQRLILSDMQMQTTCEELGYYIHLRYLNISGNHLSSIQVTSKLQYLLRLEAKSNKIPSLDLFNMEQAFSYLQYLDLSKNSIKDLSAIKVPKLIYLNLSNNQIANVNDFNSHKNLKLLELRNNKLRSLVGLSDFPVLEELYIAQNELETIDGLEGCVALKRLHMRKNKIAYFKQESLPGLPALEYLNMRENELTQTGSLNFLKKFLKLRYLGLADCPLNPEPSGELKKEILILLPNLNIVNKEEITEEDREEAISQAKERQEQEEAARKAKENEGEEEEEKEDD